MTRNGLLVIVVNPVNLITPHCCLYKNKKKEQLISNLLFFIELL